MQTTSPTLTIVTDPIETAMRLLCEAGLDFTVLGERAPAPRSEAAAA
ncbi:MAG: hypothetical protein JSV07_02160 [Acidimicrobiia bacterium]|nr:MAG: hypothetical protein JSV07_02160 [Acidimicrobiia bacterium]